MSQPRLKAMLFDIDGTLTDTDRAHAKIFEKLFVPLGIPCDEKFYQERISGRHNRLIGLEFLPSMSQEERDAFFVEKERIFRETPGLNLVPLSGLFDILRAAKREGIAVCAVTNACRLNAEFMITTLKLHEDFFPDLKDMIVIGEECKQPKPSPIPYQVAMERLGVKPEECVVFEDSPSGVQAGKAAGCMVIGLTTTQDAETLVKAGATVCVPDFASLDAHKLIHLMDDFVRQDADKVKEAALEGEKKEKCQCED